MNAIDQGADEMSGAAAGESLAPDELDSVGPHPPGDYAIVEIMGHQTLIGRIAEVTRFGAGMLQIEPIFAGEILQPILQGGAAIYRLTPCSADVAFARAPKATQRWALPDTIKATLPPALLAPPPAAREALVIDEQAFTGGAGDRDDEDFDER